MQSTRKRLAAVAALGTIGILAPAAGASAAVTPAAPAKQIGLPGAGFPAAGFVPPAGLGGLGAVGGFPAGGFPAGGFVPGAGLGGGVAFGLGVGTGGLPFAGGLGQTASVIGPTIITTAPSTFINTNNQVSAGSNLSGGQAAP
jgi:hypothetical protein